MSKLRIEAKIIAYLDFLQRKEGQFEFGYYIKLAIYLKALSALNKERGCMSKYILVKEPESYICGCGKTCSYEEPMCLCENIDKEYYDMSRFRIIEKKGTYKENKQRIEYPCACDKHTGIKYGRFSCACMHETRIDKKYIPRYIVQRITDYPDQMDFNSMLKDPDCHKINGFWKCVKDIKEFTDLEEARKFKHDLDLDEGIVIE